jgi:hypothetical protein
MVRRLIAFEASGQEKTRLVGRIGLNQSRCGGGKNRIRQHILIGYSVAMMYF